MYIEVNLARLCTNVTKSTNTISYALAHLQARKTHTCTNGRTDKKDRNIGTDFDRTCGGTAHSAGRGRSVSGFPQCISVKRLNGQRTSIVC